MSDCPFCDIPINNRNRILFDFTINLIKGFEIKIKIN